MKIGIIGLGLIGGSLAKALKKNEDFQVSGWDKNPKIGDEALSSGAISEIIPTEGRIDCDLLIIALYPNDTIEYVKNNYGRFKNNTVVTDTSGVKEVVCNEIFPFARNKKFTFVGTHPMAGIEFSGFDNSKSDMFDGASMILIPDVPVESDIMSLLRDVFTKAGFGQIVISSPADHDKRIAYTSQLAHVVSSAYVKNPEALNHNGFSAGSFQDMTRVAKLNEKMWAELFLDNKKYLIEDIDDLIKNLNDYKTALENKDEKKLLSLLSDGKKIRERLNHNG